MLTGSWGAGRGDIGIRLHGEVRSAWQAGALRGQAQGLSPLSAKLWEAREGVRKDWGGRGGNLSQSSKEGDIDPTQSQGK